MYWKGQEPSRKPEMYYYYYKPTAEVEMTAYALLAMLHQSEDNVVTGETLNIVRWLSRQRNSYGGFSSTQVRVDTSITSTGTFPLYPATTGNSSCHVDTRNITLLLHFRTRVLLCKRWQNSPAELMETTRTLTQVS
jgi:hypothetical protein